MYHQPNGMVVVYMTLSMTPLMPLPSVADNFTEVWVLRIPAPRMVGLIGDTPTTPPLSR
jgi:hypothetical protein